MTCLWHAHEGRNLTNTSEDEEWGGPATQANKHSCAVTRSTQHALHASGRLRRSDGYQVWDDERTLLELLIYSIPKQSSTNQPTANTISLCDNQTGRITLRKRPGYWLSLLTDLDFHLTSYFSFEGHIDGQRLGVLMASSACANPSEIELFPSAMTDLSNVITILPN